MQITFNQSEVEGILAAHVATYFPHIEPEAVTSIQVNEDGTALVLIGEELHEDDTPPVVEQAPRQRRKRRNPQEAKHRPVDPAPAEPEPEQEAPAEDVKGEAQPEPEVEAPTSTGGQSETTTPEPETAVEPEPETQVEEPAQETVTEEPKPATAKPSLFAGLKR